VRFREQTVHDPLIVVPLFGALSAGLIWVSWRWATAAGRAV
jgi:hypothetical protein